MHIWQSAEQRAGYRDFEALRHARCRMPAVDSALSAHSFMSPALPMPATPSHSRAPPATRGIEACDFTDRVGVPVGGSSDPTRQRPEQKSIKMLPSPR
jgi:hypothetical protein